MQHDSTTTSPHEHTPVSSITWLSLITEISGSVCFGFGYMSPGRHEQSMLISKFLVKS